MSECVVKQCSRPVIAKGLCSAHYYRFKRFGDFDVGSNPHGSPEERFWRFVDRRGDAECWPFSGGGKSTYGQFQIRKGVSDHTLAHRFSYELHHGRIPAGKIVMHSCDNPRCVNPAHLSVGTHKLNTQDMIEKGRHAQEAPLGEENGKAVLTEDTVRLIRRSSDTNVALARKLGVSINCVRGVRIGRTWAHVK